jgi:hypothetical protein
MPIKWMRVQLPENEEDPAGDGLESKELKTSHVTEIKLGNGQWVDAQLYSISNKRLRASGVEYQVSTLGTP